MEGDVKSQEDLKSVLGCQMQKEGSHVYPLTELHPCSVQSLCLVWLCNPLDCSPPGSSVHGILQARTLEWVAISFSRSSSQPRDRTHVSSILRLLLYRRFFTAEPSGKPIGLHMTNLNNTVQKALLMPWFDADALRDLPQLQLNVTVST